MTSLYAWAVSLFQSPEKFTVVVQYDVMVYRGREFVDRAARSLLCVDQSQFLCEVKSCSFEEPQNQNAGKPQPQPPVGVPPFIIPAWPLARAGQQLTQDSDLTCYAFVFLSNKRSRPWPHSYRETETHKMLTIRVRSSDLLEKQGT